MKQTNIDDTHTHTHTYRPSNDLSSVIMFLRTAWTKATRCMKQSPTTVAAANTKQHTMQLDAIEKKLNVILQQLRATTLSPPNDGKQTKTQTTMTSIQITARYKDEAKRAKDEAKRAKDEAMRAKYEAKKAEARAGKAKGEAKKAKQQARQAKDELNKRRATIHKIGRAHV